MEYGIIKVSAAVPRLRVADCKYNVEQMEEQIALAEGQGVEIIVFPELGVTGYTCQDLFRQKILLDASESGVLMLLDFTRKLDIISIVGVPIVVGDLLLNCAVVIQRGQVLGIVAKEYLPNYSEFYEKRWFASAQDLRPTQIRYAGNPVTVTADPQLFSTCDGVKFGVEICEDVWAPIPPSNNLALAGADIIFNLSASNDTIGKHRYLLSLLAQQSARTITGYVYASAGYGESTQDVVFGGKALIYEAGEQLAAADRFVMDKQMVTAQIDVERLRSARQADTTFVNAQRRMRDVAVHETPAHSITPHPFVLERAISPEPYFPSSQTREETYEEMYSIQTAALAKRLAHTGMERVVIGVSGGLDSTLALLVSVGTFDRLSLPRTGIIAVTMPGFGTTGRTYRNALTLMHGLGVSVSEIRIADSVNLHFRDIGHDPAVHDATYENSQARERTQILMDLANQQRALVVGTGDLSELALGWCTYNGDHMSMYGINAGVPKTLIAGLVGHYADHHAEAAVAEALRDVVATPISPELTPADDKGEIEQKTEDLVGPYALHDFFLYYYLKHGFRPSKIYLLARRAFEGRYSDEEIRHWLRTFCRRFFGQQFKRSCMPDGPKVVAVGLSPRGDWRMPSDAAATLWAAECESL